MVIQDPIGARAISQMELGKMKFTERQQREAASYQFELQAHKLYLSIVKRLPNYRFMLLDEIAPLSPIHAMALVQSFDFYEYRLNHGRARIDLLIVQEHNAVVPIDCLELKTGTIYHAGQAPAMERDTRKRRNQDEKKLLVSHLLLGTEHATRE